MSWSSSMGKGKERARFQNLAKYRFSIRAADNQQMRLLSDWRANTQNSSISQWPLPIRWKRRPCRRVAQNRFLLKHYGHYFPPRDDPRVAISSQSLLLAQRVFQAGGPRQFVASLPQAEPRESRTRRRPGCS